MEPNLKEPYRLKDPNGLASYLQSKVEIDKAELTRQLHDNLGGLIVAALMDAAWAEQNLVASAGQAQEKLRRVRQSLGAAIDLKRKLIEELRPTLLDNFGLFAALSWQLKHRGAQPQLRISEKFPDTEPQLAAETAIALFRYFEEALHLIVQDKSATSVHLEATIENSRLRVALSHDGKPFTDRDDSDFPEFASLKHRIWRLQGGFEISQNGATSMLCALVPLKSHDDSAVGT
jgi:signal transduction histidine kinase